MRATFAYIEDVIICREKKEGHNRNLALFKKVAAKYILTPNEEKCKYSMNDANYLEYVISDGIFRPDSAHLRPLVDLPDPSDPTSLKRTLSIFAYYPVWIPNYSNHTQPLLICRSFTLDAQAIQSFP